MKNIWTGELEWAEDPYGESGGIRLLVHARTKEGAKKKLNRHIARTKELHGFKVMKLRYTPQEVL